MRNYGFIRVAAGSPKLQVANPTYNVPEILKLMDAARELGSSILVLPELCITGYTCGDLFEQEILLDAALDGLQKVLTGSMGSDVLTLVGMPLRVQNRLYNCAVAVLNGDVLGVVPKMHLPNYKEFYEKRWFATGIDAAQNTEHITLFGKEVPFGNLIFECVRPDLLFSLGVEICEDLWAPIPPSSHQALNGALLIANLSASNELVAKADYRLQLVSQQSARCISGYIYASNGVRESTTDVVFGGDCMIAENGAILARSQRFSRDNELIVAEIDLERLQAERQRNTSFFAAQGMYSDCVKYHRVQFSYNKIEDISTLNRKVDPFPFVPGKESTRAERCEEIFHIQTAGLAKRLEHTGSKHAVIGVSGGLDSTLALLVTAKTFDILGLDRKHILAVTMPGFATTDQTYSNAVELIRALGTTFKEIDIKPACLQHFSDIDHDPNVHDVTYENVQARERTQILMDLANKVGGLVIGTGDLSELALGWATYNGDHMSMYSVNCSVPKTLVRFLVKWVADTGQLDIRDVLYRILDTPISPELVPGKEPGKIGQKTEDIIGPYELHDFFLYYFIRHGMPPKKILFLAQHAFNDKYSTEEIRKWLRMFCQRFFSQQFKRSCLPDGPKVGSVSLSPRGDWRMPSDASPQIWLDSLE